MEMIVGGAFQGKERYARGKFPGISWTYGADISEEELFHAEGVLGFQAYIRKELEAGREVSELASKLIENNPDLVLTCDEVGYGVVPMDALDRKYREAVGRVCTELAAFSHRVTRIVCGIGVVMKDV